jgi:DNA polymerase-3 subunit alpha
MSVHRDDTNKIGVVIADAKRMSIDILPVDINYSMLDFDIETDSQGERHIRFGMGAVKNLGVGACEYIIEERERNGLFQDLDDFLDRCSANSIGKRGMESLIRVGAFDTFAERPLLLHNLEKLMKHSSERHKAASVGQVSMFDLLGDQGADNAGSVLNILEAPRKLVDKREQLRWEKELVGMYLTDHPLEAIMDKLDVIITHTGGQIHEAGEAMVGIPVTIAGLVDNIRNIITKRGDPMAILRVEDIDDQIECVMFPEVWGTYRDIVEEDRVLVVRGRVDARQGDMQIIVSEVSQDFTVAHSDDNTLDTIRNTEFDWLPEKHSERTVASDNPFDDDPPDELFGDDDSDDKPPDDDGNGYRRNDHRSADDEVDEQVDVEDGEDHLDDDWDESEDMLDEDTDHDILEDGAYAEADREVETDDKDVADDDDADEDISGDDVKDVDTPSEDKPVGDNEEGEDDDPFEDAPPPPDEEFPLFSSADEPVWEGDPVEIEDEFPATTGPKGNGNEAYVDASGRLIPPSAPAAVPQSTKVRRRLIVTMTRRGDDEAEFRLLRWIYSKALSFPGTDELTVQARNPHSSELFQLDFPDLTIDICDPLVRDLRARLGEDNIQIRNI